MRAKCPICGGGVKIEDVRLNAPFACPDCGENIRVTKSYAGATWFLSLAIAVAGAIFVTGRDLGNALIHTEFAWVPYLLIFLAEVTVFAFIVMFFIAYLGKYLIVPTLIHAQRVRTSVLNLSDKD